MPGSEEKEYENIEEQVPAAEEQDAAPVPAVSSDEEEREETVSRPGIIEEDEKQDDGFHLEADRSLTENSGLRIMFGHEGEEEEDELLKSRTEREAQEADTHDDLPYEFVDDEELFDEEKEKEKLEKAKQEKKNSKKDHRWAGERERTYPEHAYSEAYNDSANKTAGIEIEHWEEKENTGANGNAAEKYSQVGDRFRERNYPIAGHRKVAKKAGQRTADAAEEASVTGPSVRTKRQEKEITGRDTSPRGIRTEADKEQREIRVKGTDGPAGIVTENNTPSAKDVQSATQEKPSGADAMRVDGKDVAAWKKNGIRLQQGVKGAEAKAVSAGSTGQASGQKASVVSAGSTGQASGQKARISGKAVQGAQKAGHIRISADGTIAGTSGAIGKIPFGSAGIIEYAGASAVLPGIAVSVADSKAQQEKKIREEHDKVLREKDRQKKNAIRLDKAQSDHIRLGREEAEVTEDADRVVSGINDKYQVIAMRDAKKAGKGKKDAKMHVGSSERISSSGSGPLAQQASQAQAASLRIRAYHMSHGGGAAAGIGQMSGFGGPPAFSMTDKLKKAATAFIKKTMSATLVASITVGSVIGGAGFLNRSGDNKKDEIYYTAAAHLTTDETPNGTPYTQQAFNDMVDRLNAYGSVNDTNFQYMGGGSAAMYAGETTSGYNFKHVKGGYQRATDEQIFAQFGNGAREAVVNNFYNQVLTYPAEAGSNTVLAAKLFRKRLKEKYGSYNLMLNSWGGVFAEYAGRNKRATTAADFQRAAEYVYGLMTIYGFHYSNESKSPRWRDGGVQKYGRYTQPFTDGFYKTTGFNTYRGHHCPSPPNNIDRICSADMKKNGLNMSTCCNYTTEMVLRKAGIYNKTIKNIHRVQDLQVGDTIDCYRDGDWKHVVMVGEIDRQKNTITIYETGSYFIGTGTFKRVWKMNDPKFPGYSVWIGRRKANLIQNITYYGNNGYADQNISSLASSQPAAAPVTATAAASSSNSMVDYALSWVGKIPYKSSVFGSDPKNERRMPLKAGRGSDCSWFVFHVLEHAGVLSKFVHSYDWGSNPSKYPGGINVGKDTSQLQVGDILCYDYRKGHSGKRVGSNSHVAIYIGNGKQVHCANGKGVCIGSISPKNLLQIVRFPSISGGTAQSYTATGPAVENLKNIRIRSVKVNGRKVSTKGFTFKTLMDYKRKYTYRGTMTYPVMEDGTQLPSHSSSHREDIETTSASTTFNFVDRDGNTITSASFNDGVATGTLERTVNVPVGLGKVHTYMGWQCITAVGSQQYKLREKAGMNFDSEGFGKINGRYVVACTTTYGKVGDYIDVYMQNGTVQHCIIGDIKSRRDAGCNQWGHLNGKCIIEYVVDKSSWYNSGHANPGTVSCHPEWSQYITKIENYGSYFKNSELYGWIDSVGEERIDFFRKVLSMSSLGLYAGNPRKYEDYQKYCLDILDYAVADFYGCDVTYDTIDSGGIVTWEDGNGGMAEAPAKTMTCTVTIKVCSDLRNLEEHDEHFKSWDLTLEDGDTLPISYMKLAKEDFSEIFNVDMSMARYGTGGSGMIFEGNEQVVYEFLAGKGYKPIQIAGIMANIKRESGFSPTAKNPSGATGLFQWMGGRLTAMMNMAKSLGKEWQDVSAQMEYAHKEIAGPGWDTSSSLNAFRNAKKAYDAGVIFGRHFERYGNPSEDDARGKLAEEYYQKIMSAGSNISYVQWAINIANNDSHGYSQASRTGNPDYDCSSLVYYALKQAGYNVGNTVFYTGSMEAILTKAGFRKIRIHSYSELRPGDILWSHDNSPKGQHTEIYVGNNKAVGAHSSENGGTTGRPGDQTGKEISVANISSGWYWVFRK